MIYCSEIAKTQYNQDNQVISDKENAVKSLLLNIQTIFMEKFEQQIGERYSIKFVYEGFCFFYSDCLIIYTPNGDFINCADCIVEKQNIFLYEEQSTLMFMIDTEHDNIQKNNDLLDKYKQPKNMSFSFEHLQELKTSLEKIDDSQAENLVMQCPYNEKMNEKLEQLLFDIQTVFKEKFKKQIGEDDYIKFVYEGFCFFYGYGLTIYTPNGDGREFDFGNIKDIVTEIRLAPYNSVLYFYAYDETSIQENNDLLDKYNLQKHNYLLTQYNQPPNRHFCLAHLQELKTSLEKINDTQAENLVMQCTYNEKMNETLEQLLFDIQTIFTKKFKKQIKERGYIKFVYGGFCFFYSDCLIIYTPNGDGINFNKNKPKKLKKNIFLYEDNSLYEDQLTLNFGNHNLNNNNLQKNNDLLTQYNQPPNMSFCVEHLQTLKTLFDDIDDIQAETLVAQCNYTEETMKKRLENLLNDWIPQIAKVFFDLFPKQIETQFSFKMVITGFCVKVFKKQRFLLINPMCTHQNQISYNQRTNKVDVSYYYVDMKETPSGRLIFTNHRGVYSLETVQDLLKKHNQPIDAQFSEKKLKELLVTLQTWNPNSQKLFPQSCIPLRKGQYRDSFLLFLSLCMTCFFTLLIRKQIKKKR